MITSVQKYNSNLRSLLIYRLLKSKLRLNNQTTITSSWLQPDMRVWLVTPTFTSMAIRQVSNCSQEIGISQAISSLEYLEGDLVLCGRRFITTQIIFQEIRVQTMRATKLYLTYPDKDDLTKDYSCFLLKSKLARNWRWPLNLIKCCYIE